MHDVKTTDFYKGFVFIFILFFFRDYLFIHQYKHGDTFTSLSPTCLSVSLSPPLVCLSLSCRSATCLSVSLLSPPLVCLSLSCHRHLSVCLSLTATCLSVSLSPPLVCLSLSHRHLSVCLSLCLTCLSVSLSLCLTCLSVSLSLCLTCLSLSLSASLVCLSLSLSVCLSLAPTCLSVSLSLSLFRPHLSVCLSLSLSLSPPLVCLSLSLSLLLISFPLLTLTNLLNVYLIFRPEAVCLGVCEGEESKKDCAGKLNLWPAGQGGKVPTFLFAIV